MRTAIFFIILFVFLRGYSSAQESLIESCPTHAQTLIKAVQNYIYAKKDFDRWCEPPSGTGKNNSNICGPKGEKKKALDSAQFALKDAQYYVGTTCNTCGYVESAFNDMYKTQIKILQDRIDVLEEIVKTTK
ncbi:MAG: hypothetical protein HKP44_05850 [Desulfofustis sp.]|nr:hypothetical protein [Desulfofustis sp.]